MTTHDKTAASLLEKIGRLDPSRQRLAEAFIEQILVCNDPDAVRNFLEWRDDPCIDSLMIVSSALDDESRDQLLFFAEDLFTEQELNRPVAKRQSGRLLPNGRPR